MGIVITCHTTCLLAIEKTFRNFCEKIFVSNNRCQALSWSHMHCSIHGLLCCTQKSTWNLSKPYQCSNRHILYIKFYTPKWANALSCTERWCVACVVDCTGNLWSVAITTRGMSVQPESELVIYLLILRNITIVHTLTDTWIAFL